MAYTTESFHGSSVFQLQDKVDQFLAKAAKSKYIVKPISLTMSTEKHGYTVSYCALLLYEWENK